MPLSAKGTHLVIGGSGQVGGAILQELGGRQIECIGTYSKTLPPDEALLYMDVTDEEIVYSLIEKLKPTHIYLPASYTNVDGCEENPELSLAVNVEGVRTVCEAAKAIKAKVIYFSSDYVFDGKSGPYSENDPVSPISVYGEHKVKAEEIVLGTPDISPLVVRTTVVYGLDRQGKNFVLRLIKSLNEGNVIPVPTDQVGSPTLNSALASTTVELVDADAMGIYNVAGDAFCDRYSLAMQVCKEFDLDTMLLVPCHTDLLNQKANRPLNAGLKLEKVRALLGDKAKLTNFSQGIKQLRQALDEEMLDQD